LLLALPLLYLVYFFGLNAIGILLPDEPRYAAIGRAMAQTGDWITPRLWGSPWFEKPALLYWMTGAATRLGLDTELAPRLPVTLSAVAFLVFFWWILNHEFGCRAAWLATLILATSGMWIGYSQSGVTDIPMTVCYSAAMLLAMRWFGAADDRPGSSDRAREARRWLPLAAALFGLSVLAKGIGPIALAFPLVLGGRRVIDWLRPSVLAAFFVVALPWYALCYLRNGQVFLHELFVVHTFGRFASKALAHGQPVWFYLPVLAGAILPWTPLLVLLPRRKLYEDPRRRFLLAWFLFTLLFFSVMLNKLPGYILPALPPVAALAGLALDQADIRRARPLLAICGLLLVLFPIAAAALPSAILDGVSHAARPHFQKLWLIPAAIAATAWVLDTRGLRLAATFTVAAGAALGVGYLKISTASELDQRVSVRRIWHEAATSPDDVCLGPMRRDWVYGLNYYAGRALPYCDDEPKPVQIVSVGGRLVIVPDRP
jgi:4-amino-4-deoxy-L-arabinose transferase-like glycosyltransferase